MNPVPAHIRPRVLSTAIGLDDNTASLSLAFDHAGYFGVAADQARAIAQEVAAAVVTWRDVAMRYGIGAREVDHMASAFEHEHQRVALCAARWCSPTAGPH